MEDELSDRHALLARTESLAREIDSLSAIHPMTAELRRRIADLKILNQELNARLLSMDRFADRVGR